MIISVVNKNINTVVHRIIYEMILYVIDKIRQMLIAIIKICIQI